MNTNAQAGGTTDLLSSIMEVTVRNEEKITGGDRDYCQGKQDRLYKTLEQLDRWYKVFKAEADKYVESKGVTFNEDGSVNNDYLLYKSHTERYGNYSAFEFLPFKDINKIMELRHKAIVAFANDIIGYFNRTYNVNVGYADIDKSKLTIGYRPTFQTYVDLVICHLGGKGFRETAEEELLTRFYKSAIRYKDRIPELKGHKIVFYDALRFSTYSWETDNRLDWDYKNHLSHLCSGIVFGLCGDISLMTDCIQGFDSNKVNVSKWYSFFVAYPLMIRFYKNGRVDIKFEDASEAERCWKKLRLDTFKTIGDE